LTLNPPKGYDYYCDFGDRVLVLIEAIISIPKPEVA